MSKHFSLFQTESQFNAAAETLEYPHVSLIDTTGESKYFIYDGKQLADAPFGSILICQNSDNYLFYVESYNTTDYPTSTFTPLGVCIYDKASNPENVPVFMIKRPYSYMQQTTLLNYHVFTDEDILYTAKDKNKTSREINTYFRNKETNTYDNIPILFESNSTASQNANNIKNNSSYKSFIVAQKFVGYGFKEGDLLVPSYNDVYKAFDANVENQNLIGTSFDTIGVTPNFGFFLCNSNYNYSNSYVKYYVYSFNRYGANFKTSTSKINFEDKSINDMSNSNGYLNPVFIPHVEEL